MRIIEGSLPEVPPATWSCPSCRRQTVDVSGRVAGRMCSGDPITGASHPPVSMLRSEPVTALPAVPAPLARVIPIPPDTLDALADYDRAPPPLYCGDCGPLVVVDNPFRREVRHRRGCTSLEVTWPTTSQ